MTTKRMRVSWTWAYPSRHCTRSWPVGVKSSVGTIDPLKYQVAEKSTPKLTNSKELLTVKFKVQEPGRGEEQAAGKFPVAGEAP